MSVASKLGVRWPTTREWAAYMRQRQSENRGRVVPAEEWMAKHLSKTGLKWTRQAIRGFRLYDFWCAKLGIAVEVDGPSHDFRKDRDRRHDAHAWRASGIVVIRVRNFDEEGAKRALYEIDHTPSWGTRRKMTANFRKP